jgi:hypothetical protein
MNQDQKIIETVGYIKKEQKLTTIENNIIPNTLVLESIHPFSGFHGTNLPEDSKPRSLFLVLSKDYGFEEIARITKKIKKDFKYDFNASIGKIHFKTSSYTCIRIKYLKSFIFLPELLLSKMAPAKFKIVLPANYNDYDVRACFKKMALSLPIKKHLTKRV